MLFSKNNLSKVKNGYWLMDTHLYEHFQVIYLENCCMEESPLQIISRIGIYDTDRPRGFGLIGPIRGASHKHLSVANYHYWCTGRVRGRPIGPLVVGGV